MNLLDSIDKSAYTLLFPDETEMSPYGASGTGAAAARSRSYVAAAGSPPQPVTTTALNKPLASGHSTVTSTASSSSAPITSNGGIKPHTILNMKAPLVNGGADNNCDTTTRCEEIEPDSLESQERKPLVPTVVTHDMNGPKSPTGLNSSTMTTATIASTSISSPPPPGQSNQDLMSHSGCSGFPGNNNNPNQYSNSNIGGMLNPTSPSSSSSPPPPPPPPPPPINIGSISQQLHVVAENVSGIARISEGGAGQIYSSKNNNSSNNSINWGPDNLSVSLSNTGTFSAGLVTNSSVYPAAEGQKLLPPPTATTTTTTATGTTYFSKDYSNIFGHIANTYETEERGGDVAKLPISNTSQGNKMFLIGLSSNVDDDNDEDDDDDEYDDDDERDLMDNEDFQSATEEMGGDGEHERGGDQDPLLVRPPSKQNVFHQFIRSATKATRNNNRRPSRNGKHVAKAFGKENQGSSRDSCSSSSALIKEVQPPHHHHHHNRHHHHHGNDANDTDPGDDIISGSSSADGMRTGRTCSIGILLAAISCVFFATSALIVKISNLHPMELLAVRGMIQGILISPIVISTGNSFMGPSGSRSLLLARAVLGAVALVMGFASIHLIQLSDAATVIFTSPVFVSIFACICLGEVCSWFDVSMIVLCLFGVLLVSKPSFTFLSTGSWTGIVGTICGLIAAMLTALAFIVLRQLKQVHYSVVVFWFSTVLAMFGAVLTVALDGFTLPRTWPAVMECIGIGLCGFMGQILLTKALQSENALPIAVTRTFDIVLAFFYQITLLHDTPDWYSYLGSVLVVSCVLLTAFRRWYKESITKKYQRVHKVPDDEPILVDDNLLHESSSSPPPVPPTRTSSHHHHHHHHPQRHHPQNEGSFS